MATFKHDDLRADLVWGPSGSGKTHQAYLAALQLWVKHKKKTRYLTADGGSLGPITPLVNLGIVSVFSLGLVPFATRLEALMIILRGGWPAYIPGTGWTFKGPSVQPNKSTFDEWGGLTIESMTSIGDQTTRDLVRRRDIKIPQTPGDEYQVTSGEERWGFRAPSHIGWVQERLEEFVDMSSTLPYKRILWTAREHRGENKKGETVIGPELPGSAATGKVPGWFGACLHLVAVPGDAITDDRPDLSIMAKNVGIHKLERRLYLMPHPDARTGAILDAKNRLPAEVQNNKQLLKGYIKSEVLYDATGKLIGRTGLNTYYDLEAELQGLTTDSLAAELTALGVAPPNQA